LVCCVGCLVSVFAGSLELLVGARVLVALGAAAVIPLAMAWVGDTVAYELRQETLARVGLGTTMGLVSGQLVGGFVTDAFGWRWAFVFLTLLFGVVACLLFADWRRQQAAPVVAPDRAPEVRAGFVAQALGILTGRWSRVVLFVAFVEGAAGFGALAIWASHLHGKLGLSLTASGAIVALFGLGGMLYMTVARRLIRRLGERGLATFGGGLAGLAAMVLGLTPWWELALPMSLLAGFGFFMFHNTLQANATQMAPTARGTGVSLFSAWLFLGQSVGVLLAASLSALVGSGAVIALGGGVLVALGTLFARGLRRRDEWMQPA
jgi:YNFM family putative membrane transporter